MPEQVKKRITKATAESVVSALEALFPDTRGQWFLADHTHEGLMPGAWSVALESHGEWPFKATEYFYTHPDAAPAGVFLEPINSWCLGIYPPS